MLTTSSSLRPILILGLVVLLFTLCSFMLPVSGICPVVSAGPDGTQGFVKPLTGCICTTQGNVTSGSFADCGGCFMSVSGSTDCTGGTSSPISNSCEAACRNTCSIGTFCPCTHADYYPFKLVCGMCDA